MKSACLVTQLIIIGLVACSAPLQPPPLAAVATSTSADPAPFSNPTTPVPVSDIDTASVDVANPATDTPAATATPLPVEGAWEIIGDGLAQRVLPVEVNGLVVANLYALRIEQEFYRFDVGYSPTQPKFLYQWFEESNADIVFNGGFFTAEYYATGLTIADGEASGVSYDFGGMVAIKDGGLSLRALSAEPYSDALALDAGLQAFPMLVNRDGSAAFTDLAVNRPRRSVIAQDHAGNVIFLVSDDIYFTLAELSTFLAQSDLDLAIAFNLDGGPSTGLVVRDPAFEIASPVLLPTVLLVYRR